MNLDIFDIRGRLAVKRARQSYYNTRIKLLLEETEQERPVPKECPICAMKYDAKKPHPC